MTRGRAGILFDAARRKTAEPISENRAQMVFRRISFGIERKRRHTRQRRAVVGLAAAAAGVVAALAFWETRQEPSHALEPGDAAVIVYSQGAVTINGEPRRATRLQRGARLSIVDHGRVDLLLPAVGELSVQGPASLRWIAPERWRLLDGKLSCSISSRSGVAHFVIEAGSHVIEVLGTQYVVATSDGDLAYVAVARGRVHVAGDGADWVVEPGRRFTPAGTVEPSDLGDEIEAAFAAPWWSTDPAQSGTGYVEVTSLPVAAGVFLDDVAVGATPLLVRWPVGHHRLAVHAEAHVPDQREIDVHLSQTRPVHIELEPTSPPHRAAPVGVLRRAEALLGKADCPRLRDLCERKTLVPGDQARLLMILAECYLRGEEKKRALDVYRRIGERLSSTRSAEEALFQTATLLAAGGELDAALGALERYGKRYPRGRFAASAMMRRCELLVQRERLDEARDCLTRYLELFPHAPRRHHATMLLAAAARSVGAWRRAAAYYQTFLSQPDASGQREEAHYFLIVSMMRAGMADADAAMEDFLSAYPDSAHRDEVRGWLDERRARPGGDK